MIKKTQILKVTIFALALGASYLTQAFDCAEHCKAIGKGKEPLFTPCVKECQLSLATHEARENDLLAKAQENDLLAKAQENDLLTKAFKKSISANLSKDVLSYLDYYLQTPLLRSIRGNNNLAEATKILTDPLAIKTINQQNQWGETALLWAVRRDNIDMVILLLKNGAALTINQANQRNETPLTRAQNIKNQKMIDLLIKNGAK